MTDVTQESSYPLTFREKDTKTLADHITLRHSVELIGMKRVGISNFLRFFLENPKVYKSYIPNNHMFVTIDLNDLVERELYAFWILTFKRIVDSLHAQLKIDKTIREEISDLFLASIQSQDLFLATEHIRTAITMLTKSNIFPTLFLLRFDRMKEAATPELLNNLQGLIDASHHRLSYVFTSARPLDQLSPHAFPRKALSGFTHIMYLKPAGEKDTKIILESFKKRYNLLIPADIQKSILKLTDGHTQYLHLACIILNEQKDKNLSTDDITELIRSDERIQLLSEEIWDSLTRPEKTALGNGQTQRKDGKYLTYTGIIENTTTFNPLFEEFVKETVQEEGAIELTKKELLLFTYLKENIEAVCDRDSIIHAVWPEYEEDGVTDWTIDRLISRLRAKLKLQNSDMKIITIKTRGYKLSKQ